MVVDSFVVENHDSEDSEDISYLPQLVIVGTVLILFSITVLYNYLLFHSFVEMFSVLVAFGVFLSGWNSVRFTDKRFYLFLGIGYLFVGGLDFIHLLAYKGMGVFPGIDVNPSVQLWIAARYLESATILLALIIRDRDFSPYKTLVGFSIVTSVILLSIFGGLFPVCYVEGVGLTSFKVLSEYVISGILLIAVYILVFRAEELDHFVKRYLIASILVTICAEMAFTLYVDVYGFFNVLGHFLKVISFTLIYGVVLQASLLIPHKTLKENRTLLDATIESTGDGIIVVSNESRIMHTNSHFINMWHISKEMSNMIEFPKLVGYLVDQVEEPSQLVTKFEELQRGVWTGPNTIIFKDGRIFEATSFPLIQDSNQVGYVYSFRNITELIRAEESATLYLDLMGHDLRNRLQGMMVSVAILRDSMNNHSKLEDVTALEIDIKRCAELISKVKGIEHLREVELERMSLNEAIMHSIQTLKEQYEGVIIDVSIVGEEVFVMADEFLKHMLLNILENAVRHNPKEQKHVWVTSSIEDQWLKITIADDGPGIDEVRKQEIFDRGRRFGGVGVHIVVRILRKYGGLITVHDRIPNDPSSGAEFRILLPESYEEK